MESLPPAPRGGRLWKSRADFFRPFRTDSSVTGQNITPTYDPGLPRLPPNDPDLDELNAALAVLADIFPDVQPEVFREMLSSMGKESRLHLVTEQLLQKKTEWVRGRWTALPKDRPLHLRNQTTSSSRAQPPLHSDELFRSESYKKATKQVLYAEFRNLSHSAIKAVLAEQNFSYSLARPVLQALSARSWRFSLSTLWSRRATATDASSHPFVIWQPDNSKDSQLAPALKRTGDAELDQELYELFIGPLLARQVQDRLRQDHAFASEVNEEQSRDAGALFDCECCYDSVPFEEICVCDHGDHFLCLECVRRTVSEALYGQGWARTANLGLSTVRCFAPTGHACPGNLDQHSLRRALDDSTSAKDHWRDFQLRVASESLLHSGLTLQRCPFCNYAEADEPPHLRPLEAFVEWFHSPVTARSIISILLLLSVTMLISPIMPFLLALTLLGQVVPAVPSIFLPLKQSWTRVSRRRRGLRFKCQDPACLAVSCMRCAAKWIDPHVCFDSEQTSLRIAVETSATAAIKRTCPRCMLSFVKSSGCNKLVCNCGYVMCYICRQEITSREGYAHFCQHFRPNGGRCAECDRCDLYGDEDEDVAIREAAEAAEKAWKEQEEDGVNSTTTRQAVIDSLIGRAREDEWYERGLDMLVEALIPPIQH